VLVLVFVSWEWSRKLAAGRQSQRPRVLVTRNWSHNRKRLMKSSHAGMQQRRGQAIDNNIVGESPTQLHSQPM